MSETKQKTSLKKKLPAGNADLIQCAHGCLYIVGWAVFDDQNFKPAELFLCPDGLPKIKVPIATQLRIDVNEYLGVAPNIIAGFSVLLAISQFSEEELPSGFTKIIFVNPDDSEQQIHAGQANIQRAEALTKVTPEMKLERREATEYKTPSFFKRLWLGEMGSNPAIPQDIINSSELTAQTLLKAAKFINERPKLSTSLRHSDVIRLAQNLAAASANSGLIILFDHNFGGGANTYSKEIVTKHLVGNNEVLRIWYQLDQTQYCAAYITKNEVTEFNIGGLNDVFRLCMAFPSFAVQVNSLWGYPHIRNVLDNLVRLRLYDFTKRMEFFAHDHIGICPSLYLLNAKHNYCGVPKSKATCTKCLSNSTQEYKVFFQDSNIGIWRADWQSFFLNCEVIRFFSNSTLNHYIRAHPWLESHPNVVVKGHEVEDIWVKKVEPRSTTRKDFNIGVFGFINFHKGSTIINDIAARIEETGDESKIYVFGSLDGASFGSQGPIELMGRYIPRDMAQHCDENNIDLVIVPSICPETFSITTKELTLIGVPVVTFDLGAQEELASNYDKGYILQLKSKVPVYDRLKKIKDSL